MRSTKEFMISSVIQYGSLLVVRDESGQQTGSITLGGGGEMLGYSSNFIVLRYGNMISTVDKNQYPMGNIVLPYDYKITGITNSGFLAQTGRMLIVYDQYCKQTGTQTI
jgi:hypothetical protein